MYRLIPLLFLGLDIVVPAPAALATDPPTVLITGSSRGIGLEFTRQYAEKGWNVIATARSPEDDKLLQGLAKVYDNISLETLDVTDHREIDNLADKLHGQPIDVLINNAGISGGRNTQQFGSTDYSVFDDVMNINVLGPLKITEAFIDHVAASDQKKIINISSTEGRLSMIRGSRMYFYRASKAALNMMMRNVALATKDKGVIIGIITPGLVDTDFLAGSRLPKQLMLAPQVSVERSISTIERLTPELSGQYVANTGEVMSW